MDIIFIINNIISNINFNPVAINIGPIAITWYALSYILGLIFSWRYALFLTDRKYSIPREVIDSFFNNAILGVIIGGRLGYVLFYNFDYYSNHPIEILFLWQGGMSFHGGLIGVIIAQISTSRKFKVKFLILTDISSLTVPFGLMLGRIANFINGELYGRVTQHPIGIVFPNGGNLPRHPSQLYEAFFEGIILFLVLNLLFYFSKIKSLIGMLTGVFILLYGVFRFLIEFFREPDAQLGLFFFTLTLGQILCSVMIIVGLLTIIFSLNYSKSI